MAEACRPWLANAIIRHEEDNGLVLGASAVVSRYCQVLKFLTFRTDNEPSTQITGVICEKTHWVRVRFDVAATDEFEKSVHGLPKQRLTSNLRSIFRILEYRIDFLPPDARQKSPWAKPSSKSASSRSGSTSNASLGPDIRSDLPMVVLDIIKWDVHSGSAADPEWFEDAQEVGMGTSEVDGRVQKVLTSWYKGNTSESQEKEMEDPDDEDKDEEEAAPSRSAKGKAKAADNQPGPEITIRKYTRPSVIEQILKGTTTKALPDWMFDVPADQRETLDSITMFGQDAEKLYQEEQAEERARAQSGSGESETDDERELAAQSSTRPVVPSPNRRLPTPRRTRTPEPLPQAEVEQDDRRRFGPFVTKRTAAKPTPSPIPSSPPIQQKASSPTSPEAVDVHIQPIPPSPEPSIPDSPGSPNAPGNPQHSLPLPTPGQRFQSTATRSNAASGAQATASQLHSSIPLPTPGQGSPEGPYTNPDSVRQTGTQNPLSLPPANQHERRRRLRQRNGKNDDSSSGSAEEEEVPEETVRSVHIDAKYDKSGLVVKSEAASSSPIQEEEEIPQKVEKKVHMMRRSRPSLDAMFEQSDGDDDDDDDDGEMGRMKGKAKRHNLDESSEGEEEDVEMDTGEGDTDQEKETDADELSDWENLQREKSRESIKTSSTSRQRPVSTGPNHHHGRDLPSSSPVVNETIQGDHRRVRIDPAPVARGKFKTEDPTATLSSTHIRHSQSQSQSQPRSKSRSGSKSQSQLQSESQSHTQTTQPISSAEEAQRIRPGQHLLVSPYPTTRTYSERLRTPSESLSPSQGSNDLRKFYLRRDGVKKEREEMMDGDEEEGEEMMDDDGDEGEDEEGGEEEEEEESGETPDKSLHRPITKRVRGKQAVVKSVESGHLASSGETVASGSSGRVLVEDSEESLERPGGKNGRVEAGTSTIGKKRKNGGGVSSPATQSMGSVSKRVKSGQTSSPAGPSQDTPAAPKRSARSFLDKINPLNMLREWTTRSQEPVLGDEAEEEEEEEVEGEEEDVKMVEPEAEEEEEEEEMEEMEELSLGKKDGSSTKVQSARPQASTSTSTNGSSDRQAPPTRNPNSRPSSSSSRVPPSAPAAQSEPKALPTRLIAPIPRPAQPISPVPPPAAPRAKSRTSSIAPHTGPSAVATPVAVPMRAASPPRSRKSTLALVDDLRVPTPIPNSEPPRRARVSVGGDGSKKQDREEASVSRSSVGGRSGQPSSASTDAPRRSRVSDDLRRVKKEDQPRVKTEETDRTERAESTTDSHRSAIRPAPVVGKGETPASRQSSMLRRRESASRDVKPDIPSSSVKTVVPREQSRRAEREDRVSPAVKTETAEVKREGIDPVKKLRGFKLDLSVDGLEEEWVREKMAEGLQERERVRRAQVARDARWASKVQV